MDIQKKKFIVEEALNQACAYMQAQIGNPTGDVAASFFAGDYEEIIKSIFAKYLDHELIHKLPKLLVNESLNDELTSEKYAFDHDYIHISNFLVSDCGRFPVSPEQYEFELINTGDQSMAHSKDFMLGNVPVSVVLTDNDRAGKAITKETKNALVTLYHLGTVDHIDSYVISR